MGDSTRREFGASSLKTTGSTPDILPKAGPNEGSYPDSYDYKKAYGDKDRQDAIERKKRFQDMLKKYRDMPSNHPDKKKVYEMLDQQGALDNRSLINSGSEREANS